MLDFGNNKEDEVAGIDQEEQSHAKGKATCSLTSTSEPVQQENRKQKGEEMEREVLSDGEKKEGIILAFYSWAITQVFNHM